MSRHFLSRHSSANNHLIGELCGLWVACRDLRHGRAGQAWSKLARSRNSSARLHCRCMPDGVDREQAVLLSLLGAGVFPVLLACGHAQREVFSREFTDTLLAMTHFLEDIAPDGGEPPQLGDADDGFVVDLPRMAVKALPWNCLLRSMPCSANAGSTPAEKAFWYQAMAATGYRRRYRGWTGHRRYPAVYPQGGYVVSEGRVATWYSTPGHWVTSASRRTATPMP